MQKAEPRTKFVLNFRGGHSQVEAKVLLLLEEVVQDVLSNEVWVQGVVYHLRSAKL